MAHYKPPRQSRAGQIIDVFVLLALTIGALYVPLWLKLAGSSTVQTPVENPTWESLGQSPVMVERWAQLGYATPADAHDLITTRFDYAFTWGAVALMVVVIVGYFVMMLRLSEKEYRDVISEKFDGK
ncbi:MAG: hypothetical protein N2422_04915 [Rhodobacteraceae bacterium]|nr:hypothetical protein [Paracoccaceae bacterium]